MKGDRRITRILNQFLKDFDATAKLSTEFAYCPSKSLITYALTVFGYQDEWFLEFAKELAPNISCDIFLLSFLHELGHHENDDNDDFCNLYEQVNEYNRISIELRKARDKGADFEILKQINFEYFNLPWEKGATEWALNYMRTHQAEVAALWKKLSKAIRRFYRLNKIA